MKQFKIKLTNIFTGSASIHTLEINATGNKIKDMFEMNKIANHFTNDCINEDHTFYKWHFAN